MPHCCACVYLWNDIRFGLPDVLVAVTVFADIAEIVEAGKFDLFVVASSSESQCIVGEDTVKIWRDKQPGM